MEGNFGYQHIPVHSVHTYTAEKGSLPLTQTNVFSTLISADACSVKQHTPWL